METKTKRQSIRPSAEVARQMEVLEEEASRFKEIDRRFEAGYEVAQLWNRINGHFLIVVEKVDYIDGDPEISHQLYLAVKAPTEDELPQEAHEVFTHPFYYADQMGK